MSGFIRLVACAVLLIPTLAVSLPILAQNNPMGVGREDYRLGAGDELRVQVFNQEDLTGEYTVDGSGQFSMPLIGVVEAQGRTLPELEQHIIDRLMPDYLVNPRVSIQVMNYRPFYIIGEVNSPSSYPFVEGMTYLNAVAIAGGFTHRARDSYAMVRHPDNQTDEEEKRRMDEQVRPGDIIRILERRF